MIEESKSKNATNKELIQSLKSQVDLQEIQYKHLANEMELIKDEKQSLEATIQKKDDLIHVFETRLKARARRTTRARGPKQSTRHGE